MRQRRQTESPNAARKASVGAAGDFRNYWPVPIAIGGRDSIGALEIASGMAFVNKGGAPLFQLRRDPRSCLVTGYTVSAGK